MYGTEAPVLLVGSIPLASAEDVLGGLARPLPDLLLWRRRLTPAWSGGRWDGRLAPLTRCAW